MFQIMRHIFAGMPIASVLIGFAGQPAILALPPALTAGFVLIRDRIIRRRVGLAAWPSDGFARHVLVDDLGWLLLLTLAGLPLCFLGTLLRGVFTGS
ncbi:hypothetical protein FF80_02120 [Devosia sp. LC5]|uniref:hypothetical protein n=1 Tax=Devosia sp. LC5 TaxID=1502724 RepID=UPI0004E43CC0|nr:hypothetical protein [Devosia sp. LC5]KFC67724.1 hypothetical protein FF80_02120 [Devosia sp. LC5]